ncbi:hypothetical protein O9G_005829 [Rozella allomycis CSF55]|uniref:Uncharacterized protein n=1 Tax=Rozella allomycis (strain CSF55) TaxID=988480 RepID=A0A075AZQ6_ROZAC|nr:hypothetical protein O9G_005829 [Rozella allomycis CSF55]|eukprot:EPZ34064.1 hypothetical protein O9G_005829 [Rozella allomycis CSF55]
MCNASIMPTRAHINKIRKDEFRSILKVALSVVADSLGSNYKDPCGNVDYMLRSGSKYCSSYDPKEYVSRYCTIYQPTMTGMTKCMYECMSRSSIVYIEIQGLDPPKSPQKWFIFLPSTMVDIVNVLSNFSIAGTKSCDEVQTMYVTLHIKIANINIPHSYNFSLLFALDDAAVLLN